MVYVFLRSQLDSLLPKARAKHFADLVITSKRLKKYIAPANQEPEGRGRQGGSREILVNKAVKEPEKAFFLYVPRT
jgi:hypothetical protein